jgi:LacI family gluconate utilization system Gnt-I transcriptional repressor
VPGDFGVVGFGDHSLASHTIPTLATVRVDRDTIGRIAAKAILGRLDGSGSSPAVTDIGFEIVRRESA